MPKDWVHGATKAQLLSTLLSVLAVSVCATSALGADEKAGETDKSVKIPPSVSLLLDGSIKEMEGDVKGAVEDYSKVIEMEPTNIRAYLSRGRAKQQLGNETDGMQDISQALSMIERGLQENPNKAELYYLRGHAKRILKQWDEAIRDTEKAIELNPKRTNWPLDLKTIQLEKKLDAKQ